MSRPIPEGLEAPQGCVILGRGGDFNVPDEGFRGYQIIPELDGGWKEGRWEGGFRQGIYAADRDSEVARLNACPDPNCTDGQTWVTNLEGQPERKDCGCQNADKDALIRELVGALQPFVEFFEAFTEGMPEGAILSVTDKADKLIRLEHSQWMDAQHALTLARTTCPEAFL